MMVRLKKCSIIHQKRMNTKMKNNSYDIDVNDYISYTNKMDKNSVDLILTDPPYTISKSTGFKKVVKGVQRFAVDMDFGEWDHEQIDLHQMSQSFYRVLRNGGTAIIWYDIWKIGELKQAMENVGFKMLRQIIWQKTNPVPLNMKSTYLSNSREMAVVGVKKGKPTFHSEYDIGVYDYPIPRYKGGRLHPTQKSLDLFNDLVLKHSNEGDVILDPFIGSGTTAIVAIHNGRYIKGCDINSKYIDIVHNRIRKEIKHGRI